MSQTSVLVVSAFGRGHSLAMQLAAKEIPVTLLDVSGQLGLTSPEEWEGPFGVGLTGLTTIQQERLSEDDPLLRQDEGLTILLPSGPLELRGPVADHRLRKLGIPQDVRDLLHITRVSATERERALARPFAEIWPLFLLRGFAANVYGSARDVLATELVYRGDTEFAVRQVSRQGPEKSLEACGRRLVHVKKPGGVKDVSSLQGKQTRSLEYQEAGAGVSEVIEYESLVWCLSGEETECMGPGIAAKIFPSGVSRPDWCWMKFRFRLGACPEREALPVHALWIGAIDLPWTHENLLIVQRTATPEQFDVWARLPQSMRFQKSFLEEQVGKITARIAAQSEALAPELHEEPSAFYQSYQETGPTRFPVFGEKGILPPSAAPQVFFHNPESWPGLGWSAIFAHDLPLVEKIETWWNRRLQEKLREKLKQQGKDKGTSP